VPSEIDIMTMLMRITK